MKNMINPSIWNMATKLYIKLYSGNSDTVAMHTRSFRMGVVTGLLLIAGLLPVIAAAQPTGVVLSVNPTMVTESATPTAVMLTATVTGGTFGENRVVRWRINDGTASQFSDYMRIGNTDLTIPANMVSGTATFMFTANVDTDDEPDGETVRIEGNVLNLERNASDVTLSVTSATLTINDPALDTAPVFTNMAMFTTPIEAAENQTAVGAAGFFFATGGDITYTLGGADASRFTLSGRGPLTFDDAPNFEMPRGMALSGTNTNDYALTVTAMNSLGTAESGAITVTVTDVNEAPVLNTFMLPVFTEYSEGTYTFTATDEDRPAQTLSFSLAANAVGATMTNDGVFTWMPGEDDGGMAREFILTVNDGIGTPPAMDTETFTITPVELPNRTPTGVTLSVDPTTVVEGTTTDITLTATLNGGTYSTETRLLFRSAIGGTATAGADFTAVTNTNLTIPANMATGTAPFMFTAATDAVVEASGETVRILGFFLSGSGNPPVTRATITINDPADTAPAFAADASIADQTYTVGTTIPKLILPEATRAISYTLTPQLPTGLDFTAGDRTITGMPTEVFPARRFIYTATNDDGFVQLIFDVAVEADAPTFGAATIDDQTYIVDTAVDVTLPVATGGTGTISYTLTPQLPTGLVFTAADYTITGMPSVLAEAQTYTYTAHDSDARTDDVATLMFTIAVVSTTEPTSITLTVNPATVTESSTPTEITLTATFVPAGTTFSETRSLFFRSAGGLAREGIDYVLVPNTDLTIPANETSVTTTFLFMANVDAVDEPTGETVDVRGFFRGLDGIDENALRSFVTPTTITINDGNEIPPDTAPAFADDVSIPDQVYTIYTEITPLILPEATGGNLPIVYTLTGPNGTDFSELPDGLTYNVTQRPRTITGTPTAATASQTFTWTATDSDGNSMTTDQDSDSFTITVMPVAPVFTNMAMFTTAIEVAENQTAAGNPNFFVSTGGGITNTLGGADASRFTLSGSGTLTFDDAPNFEMPRGMALSGTNTNDYALTVTARNSAGSAMSGAITVTVTDVNEAPTGATITGTATLTAPQSVTLMATATDPDGNPLAYTWSLPMTGDGSIVPTAMMSSEATYTPPTGLTATRTITVTVTVSDGTLTTTAMHEITVNPPVAAGTAPVFTNMAMFSTAIEAAENQTAAGPANFFIATGSGTVTLTLGGTDAALFSITDAGTLTFNAAPDFEMPRGMDLSGTNTNNYALTVTATGDTNPAAMSGPITVTVTDVNEAPPVLATIPMPTFTEHTAGTFTITATDEDAGQMLTFTLTGEAHGATLTAAGGFSWTPGEADGGVARMFTVTVTDDGTPPMMASTTFSITATEAPNRVPTFGSATIDDQTYTQDTAIETLTLPEATGGDGTITYVLTPAPPAGLTFDAATRELTGTPTAVATEVTFTYTAMDADNDAVTLTFSITVSPMVLGIDDLTDGTFNIYPNPVSGSLTVERKGIAGNEISIHDFTGKRIQVPVREQSPRKVVLDVSGLAGGMYLVKVSGAVQRLIVEHRQERF